MMADTEQAEATLLPCPFCGGKPAWGEGEQKTKYGNEQVYCTDCWAIVAPEGSKAEAAENWNSRAPTCHGTALVDREEAAKMAFDAIQAALQGDWAEHYSVLQIAGMVAANIRRISPATTSTAVTEAGEQERVCYWCKHPDHGQKVCPVPYLARGEGGLSGSYPCGCTLSTVLSDAAPPSTPAAIRAAAQEWMNTWHGAFTTNKEREGALVAILSRWFGKGETESDSEVNDARQ